MITVKADGSQALQGLLQGQAKQVNFGIARALTVTAHAVNADLKKEFIARMAGGPTPYTLRAFRVTMATRDNLRAEVALRTDAPGSDGESSGTPYDRALGHLFEGGSRRFKKLEGLLRSRGLLPAGLQIAPGGRLPVDSRGNPKLAELREMVGVLLSNLRNIQSFRRVGRSKETKAVGFFVVLPGSAAARHLHIGIWRRITSAKGSAIEPWFMYVSPPRYQQLFDLDKIAQATVARVWPANVSDSLQKALANAR